MWPFDQSEIDGKLLYIIRKLDRIERLVMSQLDDLNAAVARNTDAEDAVVVMLQGYVQQLKDALAANDPKALADVVAKIDANTAKAAAAVVANTPAA